MYDSGRLVIHDLDQTSKSCADTVLKIASANQNIQVCTAKGL